MSRQEPGRRVARRTGWTTRPTCEARNARAPTRLEPWGERCVGQLGPREITLGAPGPHAQEGVGSDELPTHGGAHFVARVVSENLKIDLIITSK